MSNLNRSFSEALDPKKLSSMSEWHKPQRRVWAKIISIVVSVTFMFPYLTWAFEATSFPQPANLVMFNQQPIRIAHKLGTITQSFQGSDRLVVHVQDLHCNYEVQNNIAKMIDVLAGEHGLELVGIEGASLPVNATIISTFPVEEVKKETAHYLVKQGKLTGAEMYAAIGQHRIRLEGIESPDLYAHNRTTVMKFLNNESQGYIFDLRETLDELKRGIYNPALTALDKKKQAFREGDLSLLKYSVYLYGFARQGREELSLYPNLRAYVSKRKAMFSDLVDSDGLFTELDLLDRRLRAGMYTSAEQEKLDMLSHRLDIMEKLVNISASPQDLAEYRVAPEGFQVRKFLDFIARHDDLEEFILDAEVYKLDAYLGEVRNFYQVADERSRAFVENIMARMQKHQTKVSMLVTGGYHTDMVLGELKQKGVSYICIKPRLSRQDIVNPYFELLRERRTPLEKLLAQNQNILSLRIILPQGNPDKVMSLKEFLALSLKRRLDLITIITILKAGLLASLSSKKTSAAEILVEYKLKIKNYAAGRSQIVLMNLKKINENVLVARFTSEISMLVHRFTGFTCSDVVAAIKVDGNKAQVIPTEAEEKVARSLKTHSLRHVSIFAGIQERLAHVAEWALKRLANQLLRYNSGAVMTLAMVGMVMSTVIPDTHQVIRKTKDGQIDERIPKPISYHEFMEIVGIENLDEQRKTWNDFALEKLEEKDVAKEMLGLFRGYNHVLDTSRIREESHILAMLTNIIVIAYQNENKEIDERIKIIKRLLAGLPKKISRDMRIAADLVARSTLPESKISDISKELEESSSEVKKHILTLLQNPVLLLFPTAEGRVLGFVESGHRSRVEKFWKEFSEQNQEKIAANSWSIPALAILSLLMVVGGGSGKSGDAGEKYNLINKLRSIPAAIIGLVLRTAFGINKTFPQLIQQMSLRLKYHGCLTQLKKAEKIRKQGKNWDAIVITVVDEANKTRIERFLEGRKGRLFRTLTKKELQALNVNELKKTYNTEIIVIVEETKLGEFLGTINADTLAKKTARERYFNKGVFDLPFDKFSTFFKLNRKKKKEIRNILGEKDLSDASGELKEQVFEYIWNQKSRVLGLHTAGTAKRDHPVTLLEEVMGNKTFIPIINRTMLEEQIIQSFMLLEDREFVYGTTTWLATDDAWVPSKKCIGSKRAIQIFTVTQPLDKKHESFGVLGVGKDGGIIKSFEKKSFDKVLSPAFPDREVDISLWNNRLTHEVSSYASEVYGEWIKEGKQLNFTHDFLTPAVTSWEECKADGISRENWEKAQKIVAEFGKPGAINLGNNSLWMAMGKIHEVLSVYTQAPYHPVLRKLLGVKSNIINSPEVEKAIKEGTLIVEKGAIVVNSDIQEGMIRKNTVVYGCKIKGLETKGNCMVWNIKEPNKEILVEENIVLSDIPYKNMRIDWPVDKNPGEFWEAAIFPGGLSWQELNRLVKEAAVRMETTALLIKLDKDTIHIGYRIYKEDEKRPVLVKARDVKWRELLKQDGIIDEDGKPIDEEKARERLLELLEVFCYDSFNELREMGVPIGDSLKLEITAGAPVSEEKGIIKSHPKFFNSSINMRNWTESLREKLGMEKINMNLWNDALAMARKLENGTHILWNYGGIGSAAVINKEYVERASEFGHQLVGICKNGKIEKWEWRSGRIPGSKEFRELDRNIEELEGEFSLEEWISTFLARRYLKNLIAENDFDSSKKLMDIAMMGRGAINDFIDKNSAEAGIEKFAENIEKMTLSKLLELVKSGHELSVRFVIESIAFQALEGGEEAKQAAGDFLDGVWKDFGAAVKVWKEQFFRHEFTENIVMTGDLGSLLSSGNRLDGFKETTGIENVFFAKESYFDEEAPPKDKLSKSSKVDKIKYPPLEERVEAVKSLIKIKSYEEQDWPDYIKKVVKITLSSDEKCLLAPVAADVEVARRIIDIIKELSKAEEPPVLPLIKVKDKGESAEAVEDDFLIKAGNYYFVLFEYPGTEPLKSEEQSGERLKELGRLIGSFHELLKDFELPITVEKNTFADIFNMINISDLNNLKFELGAKERRKEKMESGEKMYLQAYMLIEKQIKYIGKTVSEYEKLPKEKIINNHIAFPSVVRNEKGELKIVDFTNVRTGQPVIEEFRNPITSRILQEPRTFSKADLLIILSGFMEKRSLTNDELLCLIDGIRATFLWDIINRCLNHMDELNSNAEYGKRFADHLDVLKKMDAFEGEFYMFERSEESDQKWLKEVKEYMQSAGVVKTVSKKKAPGTADVGFWEDLRLRIRIGFHRLIGRSRDVPLDEKVEGIFSRGPPSRDDGYDTRYESILTDIQKKRIVLRSIDLGNKKGFPRLNRKINRDIYAHPVVERNPETRDVTKIIIYVTNAFIKDSQKNPNLLAGIIAHEYGENMLGKSHSQACADEIYFASDKARALGLGDLQKYALDQAAQEGDIAYLSKLQKSHEKKKDKDNHFRNYVEKCLKKTAAAKEKPNPRALSPVGLVFMFTLAYYFSALGFTLANTFMLNSTGLELMPVSIIIALGISLAVVSLVIMFASLAVGYRILSARVRDADEKLTPARKKRIAAWEAEGIRNKSTLTGEPIAYFDESSTDTEHPYGTIMADLNRLSMYPMVGEIILVHARAHQRWVQKRTSRIPQKYIRQTPKGFDPNAEVKIRAIFMDNDSTITESGTSAPKGNNLEQIKRALKLKIPVLIISGSPLLKEEKVRFYTFENENEDKYIEQTISYEKEALEDRVIKLIQTEMKKAGDQEYLQYLEIKGIGGVETITFDKKGNSEYSRDETKRFKPGEQRDFGKAISIAYLEMLSKKIDVSFADAIEEINKADNIIKVMEIFKKAVKDRSDAFYFLFDSEINITAPDGNVEGYQVRERFLEILKEMGYVLDDKDYFTNAGKIFSKITLTKKANEIEKWEENIKKEGAAIGIGDSLTDDFLWFEGFKEPYFPIYLGGAKEVVSYPNLIIARDNKGRDAFGYKGSGLALENYLDCYENGQTYIELPFYDNRHSLREIRALTKRASPSGWRGRIDYASSQIYAYSSMILSIIRSVPEVIQARFRIAKEEPKPDEKGVEKGLPVKPAEYSLHDRPENVLALFAEAVNRGGEESYSILKQMAKSDPEVLIDYFESGLHKAAEKMPEAMFGGGFGYDIRGNAWKVKVGKVELTPDLTPMNCYLIGKALGTRYASDGKGMLITGDQRIHTPALKLAMALGAASVGAKVEFSDEILGTGEHGLLSGENPSDQVVMVQVSGSHGVVEKNGFKIKVDKDGALEPFYGQELSGLYENIKSKLFKTTKESIQIGEISGLTEKMVDYYDQVLPKIDPKQPIVFDCRNSALIPVLKALVAKRGLQDVTWINDTPDGNMPGGIWDPSKREALEKCQEEVKKRNQELERAGSEYKAIGFVFDGDGDRCSAILEDGEAVLASDMPLPFYQRFLSDPINQEVRKKLGEAGAEDIWLIGDVRADSKLLQIFEKYGNIKDYYNPVGYPAYRDILKMRIRSIKEFVKSSELAKDEKFMEKFEYFINTYFIAEASGHQFFHICPNYPEKVIDSGIAVAFNLLYIKETLREVEARNEKVGLPEKEGPYLLTDLFEAFPKAISSDEIRIVVPNSVKFELEKRMIEKLKAWYEGRLKPIPIGIELEGDVRFQRANEGIIEVDGLKLQLKSGGTLLFRKSNTGEQATLIFEGSSAEELIQLMEDMEALILETQKKLIQDGYEDAAKIDIQDLIQKRNDAKAKYHVAKGDTRRPVETAKSVEPTEPQTATEFMREVKDVMDMLGLEEPGRNLDIMKRVLDVQSFVKKLMEKLIAKGMKEEEAEETVLNILMEIPGFKPIALKYVVLEAKDSEEGLPEKESRKDCNFLKIDVDEAGSHTHASSAYQPLNEEDGPLSALMMEKFRQAKDTVFNYRDDMILYVGRFLFPDKKEFKDKPHAYKEAPKINNQEMSDLREAIDKLRTFLLEDENVRLEEIDNFIGVGIGANEMYLHQHAQEFNQLAEELGLDFRWAVVDNPSDLPRVKKTLKSRITRKNTLSLNMSRSGSTTEPADFFDMLKNKIIKVIIWANKGRFKEKIGAWIKKKFPKTAAILNIDNTPGTIGGRHMNLKTDMVYGPLFVALTIMGYQLFKDKKQAADWAEEMLKVYVENLYAANQNLSPKQVAADGKPAKAAIENEASELANELLRKRDVEGRKKCPVIHSPSLKHYATEFLQNMNEGAPSPGKAGNNNIHYLCDFSQSKDSMTKAGEEKLPEWKDYIEVINARPELYQVLFIIDLSSENEAAKMLAQAQQLKNSGVPVKIVTLKLRKLEEGKKKEEKIEIFKHNLAVQAQATALLQTMVTTFTHLTDRDPNSNDAVKMTREITVVIQDIIVELLKYIWVRIKMLVSAKYRDEIVRIPLETIDSTLKSKIEEAQADALKELVKEKQIKPEAEDKPLPLVFQEFVKDVNLLVEGLEIDKETVTDYFVGAMPKKTVSADMAESGGLPSAKIAAALSLVEFGKKLGRFVREAVLPALSQEVIVYEKEGIRISFACPEKWSEKQKQDYQIKFEKDLPEVIAKYLDDRLREENRRATTTTIGLGHMDADSGNPNIAAIERIVNTNLAKFGINAVRMPFPRFAHTAIEAFQALPRNVANIALLPTQSFKGKFGSTKIRDRLTVKIVNIIYELSNIARMAIAGSPTVLIDYRNNEQLPKIKAILEDALGLLAQRMDREEPCAHCLGGLGLKHVLFETRNFRVVCDVHPLRAGHILIIPKEHINCMANLSPEMFKEYEQAYERAKDFLKNAYGEDYIVVGFEHGPGYQEVKHAHAHAHVLAIPKAKLEGIDVDNVQEIVNYIIGKGYSAEKITTDFRTKLGNELTDKGTYLFIEINDEKYLVKPEAKTSEKEPRFFRDRIARLLGVEERAASLAAEKNPKLMKRFELEIAALERSYKSLEKGVKESSARWYDQMGGAVVGIGVIEGALWINGILPLFGIIGISSIFIIAAGLYGWVKAEMIKYAFSDKAKYQGLIEQLTKYEQFDPSVKDMKNKVISKITPDGRIYLHERTKYLPRFIQYTELVHVLLGQKKVPMILVYMLEPWGGLFLYISYYVKQKIGREEKKADIQGDLKVIGPYYLRDDTKQKLINEAIEEQGGWREQAGEIGLEFLEISKTREQIFAKIIIDHEKKMPEGVCSTYFIDEEHNIVIILGSELLEDEKEEAIFHEIKEAKFMRESIAGIPGNQLTDRKLQEYKRQAHIRASALQSLLYAVKDNDGKILGPTPLHQRMIKAMSPAQLEQIIEEERTYQHSVVEREKISEDLKKYEIMLKNEAQRIQAEKKQAQKEAAGIGDERGKEPEYDYQRTEINGVMINFRKRKDTKIERRAKGYMKEGFDTVKEALMNEGLLEDWVGKEEAGKIKELNIDFFKHGDRRLVFKVSGDNIKPFVVKWVYQVEARGIDEQINDMLQVYMKTKEYYGDDKIVVPLVGANTDRVYIEEFLDGLERDELMDVFIKQGKSMNEIARIEAFGLARVWSATQDEFGNGMIFLDHHGRDVLFVADDNGKYIAKFFDFEFVEKGVSPAKMIAFYMNPSSSRTLFSIKPEKYARDFYQGIIDARGGIQGKKGLEFLERAFKENAELPGLKIFLADLKKKRAQSTRISRGQKGSAIPLGMTAISLPLLGGYGLMNFLTTQGIMIPTAAIGAPVLFLLPLALVPMLLVYSLVLARGTNLPGSGLMYRGVRLIRSWGKDLGIFGLKRTVGPEIVRPDITKKRTLTRFWEQAGRIRYNVPILFRRPGWLDAFPRVRGLWIMGQAMGRRVLMGATAANQADIADLETSLRKKFLSSVQIPRPGIRAGQNFGQISRGGQWMKRFNEKSVGDFEDITEDMRDVAALIKEKSGAADREVNILVTNAVVANSRDYMLGLDAKDPPGEISKRIKDVLKARGLKAETTILLTQEVLEMIKTFAAADKKLEKTLRAAYISHEKICQRIGHAQARDLEKKKYPELYAKYPQEGLLREVLHATIVSQHIANLMNKGEYQKANEMYKKDGIPGEFGMEMIKVLKDMLGVEQWQKLCETENVVILKGKEIIEIALGNREVSHISAGGFRITYKIKNAPIMVKVFTNKGGIKKEIRLLKYLSRESKKQGLPCPVPEFGRHLKIKSSAKELTGDIITEQFVGKWDLWEFLQNTRHSQANKLKAIKNSARNLVIMHRLCGMIPRDFSRLSNYRVDENCSTWIVDTGYAQWWIVENIIHRGGVGWKVSRARLKKLLLSKFVEELGFKAKNIDIKLIREAVNEAIESVHAEESNTAQSGDVSDEKDEFQLVRKRQYTPAGIAAFPKENILQPGIGRMRLERTNKGTNVISMFEHKRLEEELKAGNLFANLNDSLKERMIERSRLLLEGTVTHSGPKLKLLDYLIKRYSLDRRDITALIGVGSYFLIKNPYEVDVILVLKNDNSRDIISLEDDYKVRIKIPHLRDYADGTNIFLDLTIYNEATFNELQAEKYYGRTLPIIGQTPSRKPLLNGHKSELEFMLKQANKSISMRTYEGYYHAISRLMAINVMLVLIDPQEEIIRDMKEITAEIERGKVFLPLQRAKDLLELRDKYDAFSREDKIKFIAETQKHFEDTKEEMRSKGIYLGIIDAITARLRNAGAKQSRAVIKKEHANSQPASRLEYNKPIRRHEPVLDGLPVIRRVWIGVLGALVGVIMGVGGVFGMQTLALPSDAEINRDSAIIDLKYEYGARYDFNLKNFKPDRLRVKVLDKKAVKSWRYWSSRLFGLPIECLIEKEKEEKDELEIYVPKHVLAAALSLSGKDENGRGYLRGRISRWVNSLARLHLGHTMRYQAAREDMLIRRGLRWFLLWNRTNRLLWHGGDYAHDRLEAGPTVSDYLKGEELTVNPAEILRVVLHMVKIAKELDITLGGQMPDIDELLKTMKTKDYYSEKVGINKLLDVLEENSGLFKELLNENAFKDKASRDMIAAGVADVAMMYNEVDVNVNARISEMSQVKRLETLATEKYIRQLHGILETISNNRPEGLEEKAFFDRVEKMQACLEEMANAAETGKLIQLTDKNARYLAGEINCLESAKTRFSECGPDFKREVLFVSSPVAEMHKVKIGNKIYKFPTRTISEAMLPEVEGEKSGAIKKIKILINQGVYPVKKFRGRKARLDENTWEKVDDKLGSLGSEFSKQEIDAPLAGDLFSNKHGKLEEKYGFLLAARGRKARARAQGEFVRGIIRYMYRYAEENPNDPKIEDHLIFINALFAGMEEIDNTKEELATYQGESFHIPVVLLARGYRGALGYLLDLLSAKNKDGKVRGEVAGDVLRKYFRRLFKLRMSGAA